MSTKLNASPTLADEFTFRAATMTDLEQIHTLYTEYWKALTGVVKFTLEDFRNIFSTPGFDLNSALWVVESLHREIVGSILVVDLASPPVHPNVYGCVHPKYEGQGVGTFLIHWAEERASKAIDRVPEGARVSMYLQTSNTHEPSRKLFERLGLNPIRFSWVMMINLDVAPPEPQWPDGIRLSTYQEMTDIQAVYDAISEAFEDHWGYVKQEDEEKRFERFKHSIINDETFDPTLLYLALEEGEIAGVALCNPRLGDDLKTGWVDSLSVRKPWRRRGIALAFLHHSFGEFYRRGYRRVGLGVDTQNLSSATRLYEKAGMQVAREFTVYEKELRPGEELARQE
jgi:mycothiol synthase